MTEPSDARQEEPERVVSRDKRRMNPASRKGKHHAEDRGPAAEAAGPAGPPEQAEPESSQPAPGPVEKPAAAAPETPAAGPAETDSGGLGAELAALRTALDERTRDAQRVAAEFTNYRRRVEREKATAAEEATATVFRALLPVLDDLDRAREHGELADGVAAIADQLVATAGKFGLSGFGEKGDRFDPTRHEAVAHLTSAEVTEPTCVDVLRRGYLLGDGLLRPAMVAVASPADPDTE